MTSIPEAAGQALGLGHHIVGVHNRHVGHQLVVSQGLLDAGLLIGDDGEGGNLGAGTRGGGDSHQVMAFSPILGKV